MRAILITVIALGLLAAPASAGVVRFTAAPKARTVAISDHRVKNEDITLVVKIARKRPVYASCRGSACYVYGHGIVVRVWSRRGHRLRISASSERKKPAQVVARWQPTR